MLTKSRSQARQITFEDLKGLRAEGYVRDSTIDQKDGFGPAIQRQNIERFATSYGLILGTRWYTEFISGRSASKRQQFQHFRDDARLDTYDVLLVDHTSRFGRNQEECIAYKRELQDLGKSIVFVSQGIVSGSDRDFLSERINETLDEQYSRNLSRYVETGLRLKHEEGLVNGVAPLGYKSEKLDSGKREHKVPCWDGRGGDPKLGSMEVLLTLLRTYATGKYSLEEVAKQLSAAGYRSRLGGLLTESSVSHILENRFYAGKAIYHGGLPDEQVRDGTHAVPPEVKELWLRCQEIKQQRARPWTRGPRDFNKVYLFRGLVYCAACGSRYRSLASYHSPGNIRLRLTHLQKGCTIKPGSQRTESLSRQFAERVLPYLSFDDAFIEAVTKMLAAEMTTPQDDGQAERLKQAMEQLRKQNLWGDLPDADYQRERDSLRRQLQSLEASTRSVALPNIKRAAELLNNIREVWEHPGVDDAQRQRWLLEVFEEVWIRGKEIVSIRPRPAYVPHFLYAARGGKGCTTDTRAGSRGAYKYA